MEQSPVADSVASIMEEPPAVGLTSPGGGAHDEGDPTGMSGDEEVQATTNISADSAGARAESAGLAPGSAVQDPPAVVERATPAASQAMEVGPGRPV